MNVLIILLIDKVGINTIFIKKNDLSNDIKRDNNSEKDFNILFIVNYKNNYFNKDLNDSYYFIIYIDNIFDNYLNNGYIVNKMKKRNL